MYQEILKALAELGAYELGELSRRTGLSGPLVEQLLSEMHARGYIEPLAPECETRCTGCRLSGRCDELRAPRGWAFTEKGAAIVDPSRSGPWNERAKPMRHVEDDFTERDGPSVAGP
jgi:DNA-binding transcriptional ArsR family regulator